jgi:hypothetical protein
MWIRKTSIEVQVHGGISQREQLLIRDGTSL